MGHPKHHKMSEDLANDLSIAIEHWYDQNKDYRDLHFDLRLAEAIHILTWKHPHSHALLMLLFDEECPSRNIKEIIH